MLGMKAYDPGYVESCRAHIAADIAALRALKQSAESIETAYCNNLAVVLEAMFVHRLRTVEGKDGNPLNELRIIVDSLLANGGVLTVEKAIKYAPAKSVLGLEPGATIALTANTIERLAEAVFAEIQKKFV